MLWSQEVELVVALLLVHETCEELTAVTGDELSGQSDHVPTETMDDGQGKWGTCIITGTHNSRTFKVKI